MIIVKHQNECISQPLFRGLNCKKVREKQKAYPDQTLSPAKGLDSLLGSWSEPQRDLDT